MPGAIPGDELLFDDLDGATVGLDDVIADGLDRDYSARYGGLRDLLAAGTPAQRLHACVVLASWGVRDGFLTIVDWATDPHAVPWAGAPVTFDRLFGVDDAFAQLARALETAAAVALTPAGTRLRVGATRALLGQHHHVFFDRWMQALVETDAALAGAVHLQLLRAAERTVAAARTQQPFDMATQAALLLVPLAETDDEAAARLASQLTALAPDWPRTLCEVARGMGAGRGPATRYALERLAASPHQAVATEARDWLARRDAHGG
ncbi:MAG: hypothetical protein ACLGI2_10140 [Acidimicrobiia bacterium]